MIEFGKSLRAAREAKGYSVRQVAEKTRMAPMSIEELEAENFSHIAAPIYGRGFVKLYCEAVGTDPKPFIDEFMEIYNGNRELVIRERPVSKTVEPPAAPPPEAPVAKPPKAQSEPDLFLQAETTAPAAAAEPTLSRYAAPIRNHRKAVDPQIAVRIGALAVGALVLLGLLIWGVCSVYRATTHAVVKAPSAAAAATPSVTPGKQAARTPQKIPSLYID